MRRNNADITPPCGCGCACGCPPPSEPVLPPPPAADVVGPSSVDNPVPLSNGINIPTLGVIRGYRRYYSRCIYLNPGEIPPPQVSPYLQVSNSNLEFNFYPQPSQRIDVLSYPRVQLSFGNEVKVTTDGNVTRVYPTASIDYYVEFVYTQEGIKDNIISAYFDVIVYGYDLPEADGMNIPFVLTAGDLTADGKIVMPKPFMTASKTYIFLSPANDNTDTIYINSNLSWFIELP